MKNRYFLLIGLLLAGIAIQAEELKIIPHQGVTGTVQYDNVSGTTYKITATPVDGFEFLYWIINSETSTENPITANISANIRYTAVFGKTSALNKEGGKVTVTVNNAATPSFDLTAANGSCASFVKWSNNSTANPLVYQESDGAIEPEFPLAQKMKVEKTDECGTIDVKLLDCGYTLTAKPAVGYAFVEWTDKVDTPIRDEDYEPGTYSATFAAASFKVGDAYYLTMAEAEAAAGDSVPVEQLTDVTDMVISKHVTLQTTNKSVTNLTIEKGASLTLTSAYTATNLFLQVEEGKSSQLFGAEYLNCTNAYCDVTLEKGEDVASPDKWYAFSVPFDVDVTTGVHRVSDPSATLTNQEDYLIKKYDGAQRAKTGKGWVKMINQGDELKAGRFYMIGIKGTENTWRFTKKTGASVYYADNTMALEEFAGSVTTESGWNAVGNAKIHYADAAVTGINFVQVFDNKESLYQVKYLASTTFTMACPFFVQVDGSNTLTYSESSATKTLRAPQRDNSSEIEYFELSLNHDDYLYVSASDKNEDIYIIGRDLIRLSETGNKAALWVNAYNQWLCAHQAVITNNAATCALSLYAPEEGDYTLTCNRHLVPEGQTLYLVKNGIVVGNLTEQDYTLHLEKGIKAGYQLKINDDRGISTSLYNASLQTAPKKIVKDGALYILVNERMYNAQGCMIQ